MQAPWARGQRRRYICRWAASQQRIMGGAVVWGLVGSGGWVGGWGGMGGGGLGPLLHLPGVDEPPAPLASAAVGVASCHLKQQQPAAAGVVLACRGWGGGGSS